MLPLQQRWPAGFDRLSLPMPWVELYVTGSVSNHFVRAAPSPAAGQILSSRRACQKSPPCSQFCHLEAYVFRPPRENCSSSTGQVWKPLVPSFTPLRTSLASSSTHASSALLSVSLAAIRAPTDDFAAAPSSALPLSAAAACNNVKHVLYQLEPILSEGSCKQL